MAEHDVGGESSPSPAASPSHINHPTQQQTEMTDTGQPQPFLGLPLRAQDLGDTAQKSLCSSTQVRTADGIEQDYIYVYSDEDIRSWVC